MNLHVFIDAPFYVDHFMDRCARLGIENQYYTSMVKRSEVKHINQHEKIDFLSKEAIILKIKSKSISRLYIHYLDDNAIDLLKKVPENIKIYWFFWGNDGYKHPDLKRNIYLEQTKDIIDRVNPRRGLKLVLDKFREYTARKRLNNAFKKIDFCCIQVKGDYQLIKSLDAKTHMKHHYFAYRGVERNGSQKSSYGGSRKQLNLLLGNSANPSNNHIDAFLMLNEYKGQINQILCPLSYSGSKEYVREVIKKGRELFGEKFIPLETFLPLDEYQKMVDSVDVGVFYHSRQQAYSNTVMLLEQNKQILMNPKSTLYQMYKDFEVNNVYDNFSELLNSEINDSYNLYKNLGENIIDSWYSNVIY